MTNGSTKSGVVLRLAACSVTSPSTVSHTPVCFPRKSYLFGILGLSYNQLTSNLISQAAVMSDHGVPNDVLSNLDPFALIICIPICDLLVRTMLVEPSIHLCFHCHRSTLLFVVPELTSLPLRRSLSASSLDQLLWCGL